MTVAVPRPQVLARDLAPIVTEHRAKRRQVSRRAASLSYEEPEGSEPERCQGRRAGGGGDSPIGSERSNAHPARFATARQPIAGSRGESGDDRRAPQHCHRSSGTVPRSRRTDDADHGCIAAPTGSACRDRQRRIQRSVVHPGRLHLGSTCHSYFKPSANNEAFERSSRATEVLIALAQSTWGTPRYASVSAVVGSMRWRCPAGSG
jgi:hypothetical protein